MNYVEILQQTSVVDLRATVKPVLSSHTRKAQKVAV